MDILLHPVTQRQLEATIHDLPQSLLLAGKNGVGLRTIAQYVARKEHAATIEPRNTKGEIDLKAGTISIEVIRDLYNQTRTKQSSRRIIIIDNAERMSRGAQAAFLKLLEEPNAATHFILTSHQPNVLLATIRSRVQQIVIQPLTPAQTEAFISAQNGIDEKKKLQLQFIAPGLPAELHRLLADEAYFEAKAAVITNARILLQSDTYHKLRLIHGYRANREECPQLIDGAITIARHTLSTKPQQSLIKQVEQLLEARERIAANHSIVLTLARIVL